MIKLKDILTEKKKLINEFTGVVTIGLLMKYLMKWSIKNPRLVGDLKDFVNKKL